MSRYYLTSIIFLVLLLGSLALDGTIIIPSYWYVSLVMVYVAIVMYGAGVMEASFFVKVKHKGTERGVALTFDDGPLPGKTDRILQILKQHNVQATFFCIGHRVDDNPQLLKAIDEHGHLIGNHTYWHGKTFDIKSAPMVVRELYDTDVAIYKATGKKPRFFRPPYGVTNPMIAKALKRFNHTVVGWSIRSLDSVISDRKKLFDRVTRKLDNGDIVLFHDYSEATIDILPEVIEHIRKRGLELVRLDQLLNEKPYG